MTLTLVKVQNAEYLVIFIQLLLKLKQHLTKIIIIYINIMPKQKNNNQLGRAIIKKIERKRQQIVANKPVIFVQQSQENQELKQKQKLKSILQENPMAQFLHVAELSNQNFEANRNLKFKEVREEVNNRKIISGKSTIREYRQQSLNEQQKAIFLAAEKLLRQQQLQLPQRPKWDAKTTKQSLEKAQNQSYLRWRRALALIEEKNNVHITPYEKNLEIWKQLWRVVERSDLLIQIVDGRDPLFFFCQGLFDYIKNLNNQQKQRQSLILINKSDLTSQKILNQWNQYLIKNQINHIFFSAKQKHEQSQQENIENSQLTNDNSIMMEYQTVIAKHLNSPSILSIKQLAQFLTAYQCKFGKEKIEVGMIGYPNVGKSSVINALLGQKKVGVASMPGKTKHFQTLILNDNVTLVDCPGLVFPKIASSVAYMMLNGLYSVDTIKDFYTPIKVLVNRIPKKKVCEIYSLHWKQTDPYTVDNLLDKYATLKGYFGGSGLPNQAVAARSILKDYVTGALVFCQIPPGYKREEQKEASIQKQQKNILEVEQQHMEEQHQKINEVNQLNQQQQTEKELDQKFFTQQLKHGNKNQQEVIQMLTPDDLLDLIEGKKIGGIKLPKDVKRQIKYALKRGQDIASIKKNYLGGNSNDDRKTCIKVQ